MPRISYFYGITIRMYWSETHHSLPHFHARYGEHKASFDLTGEVIVGNLPQRQLRLVQAWAELHTEELKVDWDLAVMQEPLIPFASMIDMDHVFPGELVDVTGVEVIGEYRLRLTFEDGIVGDVSFTDREWKGVFEPFRDPKRFAKVSIEDGTLVWPEDGLDMAPEPLYEKAARTRLPSQAA